MKLKRVSERQSQTSAVGGGGKAKKSDVMIAKFAGGLCFDFSAADSNMYLVFVSIDNNIAHSN